MVVPCAALEDAPGVVTPDPSPLLRPTGMGSVPLLGAIDQGDSGLGSPEVVASPQRCTQGSTLLLLLLPGLHEGVPLPEEKLGGEWGIFPFVWGIVGPEHGEGSAQRPAAAAGAFWRPLAADGQRASFPLLRLPTLVSSHQGGRDKVGLPTAVIL